MRHTLKIWPRQFAAVRDGRKKHEYRKNDRDFQVGDVLNLHEWKPSVQRFTGAVIEAEVTYISRWAGFGIPDGYCVMSIKKICGYPA